VRSKSFTVRWMAGFQIISPTSTIPGNLRDLIDRLNRIRADVGIGYDGDADRIGVVDDRGNIIWGDQLMILFSREILEYKKGAVFVAEVKCSQNLFDDIENMAERQSCGEQAIP